MEALILWKIFATTYFRIRDKEVQKVITVVGREKVKLAQLWNIFPTVSPEKAANYLMFDCKCHKLKHCFEIKLTLIYNNQVLLPFFWQSVCQNTSCRTSSNYDVRIFLSPWTRDGASAKCTSRWTWIWIWWVHVKWIMVK